MKTSLSSFTTLLPLIFLFFFFVSSANCTLPPPPTSSRNTLHPHYCDSFLHTRPRSLCIHLQRKHPVPAPQQNGVDPRYGSEKRRVPTGPNPLHN
ncbi:hypothetical protein VNO77_04532 [Canavalia gladiata]|uniref:CLAVATA3/ESR (CLE)-related protein 9 n=1 Tax=Canavalia gladiata TaxID=3824 RepID=A0AAN9R7U7_CANGL